MKLRKLYIILLALGVPLLIFGYPIALGWVLGQTVMVILVTLREVFYTNVLDSTKFSMKKYVSYVIFTIVLIAGPLLFSFFFRDVVEPLAIFAAYFIDRVITFIFNLFSKEKTNYAK